MELLKNELLKQGVELDQKQLDKFKDYASLLIETNKVMNLTTVTDEEGIQIRHFYDSLSPLFFDLIKENASVIDVGTGAGFPGLPLKIARSDIKLTLTDSLNKRLEFLKNVTDKIDEHSQIVHARAEDLAHDKDFRERYDICVSRAVAPLNVLCELTLPFVKPQGISIFYKGKTAEEELKEAKKALETLGAEYVETKCYFSQETPFSLIICRKTRNTPQKYPRKAGIPKKSPL